MAKQSPHPPHRFRNLGNWGILNPGPWNPKNSCRNPESQKQLESGIQVSLKKIWNPVIRIRSPRRGIHNRRLSWIPLHGGGGGGGRKTSTLYVHHAFLYISLPSLHDYNVKLPNFTFCRGSEHKTTTFFFFSSTLIQSFRIQL